MYCSASHSSIGHANGSGQPRSGDLAEVKSQCPMCRTGITRPGPHTGEDIKGRADSPALPQPPATALAMPTTVGENMMEDQNWQMTKAAREHPMNRRSMM